MEPTGPGGAFEPRALPAFTMVVAKARAAPPKLGGVLLDGSKQGVATSLWDVNEHGGWTVSPVTLGGPMGWLRTRVRE